MKIAKSISVVPSVNILLLISNIFNLGCTPALSITASIATVSVADNTELKHKHWFQAHPNGKHNFTITPISTVHIIVKGKDNITACQKQPK